MNKVLFYILFLIGLAWGGTHISSCSLDEDYALGAKLRFSRDTLFFDTVFTTMGSATRRFKVYNDANKAIVLKKVRIGGGLASPFNMNVNGKTGPESSNIEILPKDSAYVFVNVNVNPNALNAPFVIRDSVLFLTDGSSKEQSVILDAWGQNANYLVGNRRAECFQAAQGSGFKVTIGADFTMTNDRPWVLLGIVIVQNAVLTIQPGTKVHMFGGPASRCGDKATLILYDNATLNAVGNAQNPIEFRTHRTEYEEIENLSNFQNIPAQNNGIWFLGKTRNNKIEHAIIRNATYGVYVDSLSDNGKPKLDIRSTKIYNCSEAGVLGFQANIYAENVLIYNMAKYDLLLIKGGDYLFNHCSFLNYGKNTNIYTSRTKAILSFRNYAVNGQNEEIVRSGSFEFNNCIFYGTRNEEIEMSSRGTAQHRFAFNNCVIRRDTFNRANRNFNNCIINPEPKDTLFKNVTKYPEDYSLHPKSPAINTGKTGITNYLGGQIIIDILNRQRTDGKPDIGCYEF